MGGIIDDNMGGTLNAVGGTYFQLASGVRWSGSGVAFRVGDPDDATIDCTFIFGGSVISEDSNAIMLWPLSAGNRITVLDGGLVSGLNGIAVQGDETRIHNAGTVLGNALTATGSAVAVESVATGCDLVNGAGGRLWGAGNGVVNSGGLSIANAGEIDGGTNGVLNFGTLRLDNDGVISGDTAVRSYGRADIVNTGKLLGWVLCGDADDRLVTTDGTLVGEVHMGAGDDTVRASRSDDVVDGGTGNDVVSGHDGEDMLFGGTGNDRIRGGAGDDQLAGDGGRDTFLFSNGCGFDLVIDFGARTDRIDVSQFGFANFAEVRAAARDIAAGVVIAFDGNDAVFLRGIERADLVAGDVIL